MEDRIFFLEETIKDLEIRNRELQKMVDDQLLIIRDLETKADSLNGSLSRWKENWQAVHDREIVMGEKINRLKEFAEDADPNEIVDVFMIIEKIRDLC